MTHCDKSIEILRATNDGNDLSPPHLYLVECAVNGFLTDKGKAAFSDLLKQVRAGYVAPWFHGIEHLTHKESGFIYWKGQEVEHYSGNAYSQDRKADALELAARCRHLESLGVEVNTSNAIWKWEQFAA